jgi:tetratricopeptide (TPR) repeat protein
MELKGRTVALYGRFSPGVRDRLERQITERRGHVLRDLTRHAGVFVVGALAGTLIESGALGARLRAARERGVPILGERAFAAALSGEAAEAPTLPLATALGPTPLTRDDADLLAAFDLIEIGVLETGGEACRFADAGVIRTAGELVAQGRSRAEVVRILGQARDLAPRGRRRIGVDAAGEAVLEWDDGRVTSLEGQGYLPLDADHPTLDDLFEAAALAEAAGDLEAAARLYDQCARADRKDAIAPYNLGNIRLAQGAREAAAIAYQQALARDRRFSEARYNLAQALEALERPAAAVDELKRLLASDAAHADAVFNLAQLTMQAGDLGAARALYERYLRLDPPEEWAAMARKAILVCSAAQSA